MKEINIYVQHDWMHQRGALVKEINIYVQHDWIH